MKPAHFQKDFGEFEKSERKREIDRISAARVENAKEAWRIARHVPGYDRTGFWPHIHEPHDELVDPMYVGKACGLIAGAVFSNMLVDQYLTDPTATMYVTAAGTFLVVSLTAESGMCAWQPIPQRFKSGPRLVAGLLAAVAVPLVTWLLMRVPGTVFSDLANNWEGVTLIGTEVTLLLFGAAAGATVRALRWSRKYYGIEVGFRNQLIELGAEPASMTIDEAELATE